MRHLIMISAACLFFTVPSWSADTLGTALFGTAGFGRWWDDDGAPIGGLALGGSISRRLLPQFALEFEGLGFFGTRGGLPNRSRSEQFLANGVLYLHRRPRTQFFILLGAGGAHSTGEIDFADYHHTQSHSGFVANAGAGMEIYLSTHVSLRPEFRLLAGNSASSSTNPFTAALRTSMGIGYHW